MKDSSKNEFDSIDKTLSDTEFFFTPKPTLNATEIYVLMSNPINEKEGFLRTRATRCEFLQMTD